MFSLSISSNKGIITQFNLFVKRFGYEYRMSFAPASNWHPIRASIGQMRQYQHILDSDQFVQDMIGLQE